MYFSAFVTFAIALAGVNATLEPAKMNSKNRCPTHYNW